MSRESHAFVERMGGALTQAGLPRLPSLVFSALLVDDAWHGALMRTDQLYAPMIAALTAGIRDLGKASPAHERLLLTREFLSFVNDEMAGLVEKWEQRRAEIRGG